MPAWTFAQLKAADAALGIDDPASAAETLQARRITVVRDISCTDARSVLFATGEYGALVLLSRQNPSDTVPATLIAAAITAVATLDNASVIEATDPAKWQAVQTMLGAFVQAQAVSPASRDTLLGMREVEVPTFEPAPTAGDVQTARNEP